MAPLARILAPAKVNLWLKVVGKRPDGYHELDSLMAPVALYDELEIDLLDRDGQIEVATEGSPHVLGGEKNICHKAAEYFFAATKAPGGARIMVKKNIPVGAGLGGGSSDAAAVIMALAELHSMELEENVRTEAGFKVGADVPFFFAKGPARIKGIGEKVEPVKECEKIHLVIVHPGVFLSTASVFSRFTMGLTSGGQGNTIPHFNFQGIVDGLRNDLEAAAIKAEPAVGEALAALRDAKAVAAMMTGSGSASFGIFVGSEEAKAGAEKIRAAAGTGWRVEATHIIALARDYPQARISWGVGKR